MKPDMSDPNRQAAIEKIMRDSGLCRSDAEEVYAIDSGESDGDIVTLGPDGKTVPYRLTPIDEAIANDERRQTQKG